MGFDAHLQWDEIQFQFEEGDTIVIDGDPYRIAATPSASTGNWALASTDPNGEMEVWNRTEFKEVLSNAESVAIHR